MEFCPKCGSLLRVRNVYGDQYQMICILLLILMLTK